MAKDRSTPSTIPQIRDSSGNLLTGSTLINERFANYFKDLYTAQSEFDRPEAEIYLSEIDLPRLSPDDREMLAAQITLEENYDGEPQGTSPGSQRTGRALTLRKSPTSVSFEGTPQKVQRTCRGKFLSAADHPTNYITRKWHPTNVPEMKAYVGLTLSMSINPKPQIKMYWSRDLYHNAPLYPAIMPRQRFELLSKFFHLNDNSQDVEHTNPSHDRLFKLRPLLTHLSAVFMDVYTPHREIAVDESLVPFHGRLSMKQYIPSKRARCGVKIYRACESGTGYTFTFKIYEGKDSILQPAGCPEYISTSGKIVVDLLNPLLHQGYHVYLDNFYTSVPLFKFLFSVQTGACGTVRANRKGLPPQVVNKKLCRGESYALRSEELLAIKFHDKREVMMLSTIHTEATVLATSRTEQRTKPEAIVAYNKNMGAVDLSDQVLAPYLLRRRRKAWYKKITFFLLQMTMHNAFVVYLKTATTPTSQQMTFLDFQIQVHKSLMYSPG
ncbi:piggyBac transposable element-derived protein 4-like [Hyperolius riggenbachi]|uniref:piggyBac transposable element-derived protein 4-like n=1 Tax=Hyperolius riggenbachi TaxID=752182 RepID=UPI0035A2C772